ncbi:MAG: Unknown protein [uncultured Sulfurovum sp.]|uniref:Lipoprotein n=1 Tax=uncultured Sulfurovum sp. TaxID=269237 RepID=A0A6S6UCX2_9BACT|nr:MAG: Unknown protein [uncultured Sulfurovum sp.]
MNKKINTSWILVPLSFILIGCGDTSNTSSIDLSTYLETDNMSKNYQKIETKKGEIVTDNTFPTTSIVSNNRVERNFPNNVQVVINIGENTIIKNDISSEGNTSTSFKRLVNVGDTLNYYDVNLTKALEENEQTIGTQNLKGHKTCVLESKLNGFTHETHTYTGDIVRVKCTLDVKVTTTVKDEFLATSNYSNGTVDMVDSFYMHSKKSEGLIAFIDDDCLINNNISIPNDNQACTAQNKNTEYMYYIEN